MKLEVLKTQTTRSKLGLGEEKAGNNKGLKNLIIIFLVQIGKSQPIN